MNAAACRTEGVAEDGGKRKKPRAMDPVTATKRKQTADSDSDISVGDFNAFILGGSVVSIGGSVKKEKEAPAEGS